MIDLKSIAQNALYEAVWRYANNVSAHDVLEDDPEAALLSDADYDKLADMVANATVTVKVVVH